MIRTASACFALFVLGLPPVQATAKQRACPGFPEGSATSPTEVDRFYLARAVAIVRAGLAGDTATLGTLISPDATFFTWRGDYATGGRKSGVAGAIAWAKDLNPSRFESAIDQLGAIAVTPSACEQTTRILFRTPDAAKGVTVTLEFVEGQLVRASGRELLLVDGDIR